MSGAVPQTPASKIMAIFLTLGIETPLDDSIILDSTITSVELPSILSIDIKSFHYTSDSWRVFLNSNVYRFCLSGCNCTTNMSHISSFSCANFCRIYLSGYFSSQCTTIHRWFSNSQYSFVIKIIQRQLYGSWEFISCFPYYHHQPNVVQHQLSTSIKEFLQVPIIQYGSNCILGIMEVWDSI